MSAPASPSSHHSALVELSGTVLESRYQLGRVLGAGGMGAVFEATHLRLDRRVAIKVLRPVFVGHDEYIKRFLREAKVASKIRHRNVVELLDFGETSEGLVYSVMELLEGQDLEQLLRARPNHRLSWIEASDILVQVVSGLKAAHAVGVVHRDIKPANCFLTREDGDLMVKVVDFGIAKIDETDQTQQLTGTAQILGTPSYIAPELIRTKSPASPKSDIYSLGVLAYRMLTGRLPFSGETIFEVLHGSCFEAVPPLRDVVPELPLAVESFVLDMLAKDPDDRPPDMLAVRERLLELARELGTLEVASSSAFPIRPTAAATTDVSSGTPPLQHTVLSPAAQPASPTVKAGPRHGAAKAWPPNNPGAWAPGNVGAVGSGGSVPVSTTGEATTMPSMDPVTVHDDYELRRPRSRRLSTYLLLGGLVALSWWAMETWLETHLDPHDDDVPAAPSTAPERSVIDTPEDSEDGPSSVASATAPGPGLDPPPSLAPVNDDSTPVEPPTTSAKEPPPKNQALKTRPPRSSTKSKPAGPPTDGVLMKRLKKKIESKCADSLDGRTVKISFYVKPSGEIGGLGATPPSDAGTCSLSQIGKTRFRSRPDPTPMEFTVK